MISKSQVIIIQIHLEIIILKALNVVNIQEYIKKYVVYVSLTWSSTDTLFIKSPISLTQYFSFFMFALRCALALIANVASLSIIYGSLLSCTSTIILLSMNVGCVAVLVSLLVVTIVVLAVIVLINGVVF